MRQRQPQDTKLLIQRVTILKSPRTSQQVILHCSRCPEGNSEVGSTGTQPVRSFGKRGQFLFLSMFPDGCKISRVGEKAALHVGGVVRYQQDLKQFSSASGFHKGQN